MADEFDDALEEIGADFSALCAGQATVTVRQIDPDTGAVRATAEGVTALKRARRRQPVGVSGGELGGDQCRFVLRASELGFLPRARDQIEDTDGTAWVIDSASAIGFHQLYACDVTLERL